MRTVRLIYWLLSFITSAIGIIVCVFIFTNANAIIYAFDNDILKTKLANKQHKIKFPVNASDSTATTILYPNLSIPFNITKQYDREKCKFYSSLILFTYRNTRDIKKYNLKLIRQINPFDYRLNNKREFPFGQIRIDCKRNLYISFTGTSSLKHWLCNIKMKQVSYDRKMLINFPHVMRSDKKIMIHHGFLILYSEIISTLEKIIYKYSVNNPDIQIHITGHSLGGAIACILYKEFMFRQFNCHCYVYGCPRVGNGYFAKGLENIIRVVNTEDIVPNAPSIMPNFSVERFPFNYVHSGTQITFTKNLYSLYNNHSISAYHLFDSVNFKFM